MLEALYGEKDPAFLQLAELMGTGRDDRRLTAAVRRLYDFIQSHPYPDQWLEEKQALFTVEGPVGETSWGRLVRRQMEQTLLACVALLDKARELADGEGENGRGIWFRSACRPHGRGGSGKSRLLSGGLGYAAPKAAGAARRLWAAGRAAPIWGSGPEGAGERPAHRSKKLVKALPDLFLRDSGPVPGGHRRHRGADPFPVRGGAPVRRLL